MSQVTISAGGKVPLEALIRAIQALQEEGARVGIRWGDALGAEADGEELAAEAVLKQSGFDFDAESYVDSGWEDELGEVRRVRGGKVLRAQLDPEGEVVLRWKDVRSVLDRAQSLEEMRESLAEMAADAGKRPPLEVEGFDKAEEVQLDEGRGLVAQLGEGDWAGVALTPPLYTIGEFVYRIVRGRSRSAVLRELLRPRSAEERYRLTVVSEEAAVTR